MDHAAKVARLHPLLRYRDTGTTSMRDEIYRYPTIHYTCQQQAVQELDIVFRRYLLLLGLSCDLLAPGDYVTDDFSGVPILAVRDDDGRINAFVDVCRHRGPRLVQGDHPEAWRVYPGDTPDESKMPVSLYAPQSADIDKAKRYWDRNMDLLLTTLQQQDVPIAKNVQRDFHSGAQAYLTFGRNEPALAHFHQEVKVALTDSDSAGC